METEDLASEYGRLALQAKFTHMFPGPPDYAHRRSRDTGETSRGKKGKGVSGLGDDMLFFPLW